MPNSIDLGTDASVAWALEDAGATVVLTVTAPDGSTSTPAVTESSGTYQASIPTTLPGRYWLRWERTSGDALVFTDTINVSPQDDRTLVALDEAKSMLNIPANSTRDDDNVRIALAAVTVILEDLAGAILVREVVQYADGGKTGVALHERPDEIISVTEDGTVLTAGTGYVLNKTAAIVYAGGPQGGQFMPGRQVLRIVYTVGSAKLTPNLRLATTMLLRNLYELLQNGHNDYPQVDGEIARSPSGYAVPYRVLELVRPSHRLPGIG